jgi:hypothetical protein
LCNAIDESQLELSTHSINLSSNLSHGASLSSIKNDNISTLLWANLVMKLINIMLGGLQTTTIVENLERIDFPPMKKMKKNEIK